MIHYLVESISYLSLLGGKHSLMISKYVTETELIYAVVEIGYFVYKYKKIVN